MFKVVPQQDIEIIAPVPLSKFTDKSSSCTMKVLSSPTVDFNPPTSCEPFLFFLTEDDRLTRNTVAPIGLRGPLSNGSTQLEAGEAEKGSKKWFGMERMVAGVSESFPSLDTSNVLLTATGSLTMLDLDEPRALYTTTYKSAPLVFLVASCNRGISWTAVR